ncbi:hypothetical protein SCP_0505020 [Sparassis crispa]|uniref:Uncharacterized protein n=1 Tax=Sparassis crispa TaxID=139825 RepID=A0A401GML3_9APHY|nr:hypothetical protein SCP_0505020 [Sparassis crispa]GBE83453.1 hypothetical protein SCP_0505020 [Sparassis crispa]
MQAPIRNAGTPQDPDRSASQPPTSDSTFDAKFKVPLTSTAMFKRSYSSQLPPHTAAILANILPMKVVFFWPSDATPLIQPMLQWCPLHSSTSSLDTMESHVVEVASSW